MDIAKSNIVKSIAGRDAGDLFFVLASEEDFLLLADGKRRRVEQPKRKRRKHVMLMAQSDAPVARKSETARKSRIVSFVEPLPHTAAVIKTRR